MKIAIGIADDHQLFLKSLGLLIDSFPSFKVTSYALNGEMLLKKLALDNNLPEIVLLDVDMPVMNGIETAQNLYEKYPTIKTVALSIKDDDITIINMLRAGCCAYLLKDIHPDELEKALLEIHLKGYYNSDASNINYRRLILRSREENRVVLSNREKEFLILACSDRTYKQIAAEMYLSERTIDGYRESLFQKLNVQSRTGMALEAIRKKLVAL